VGKAAEKTIPLLNIPQRILKKYTDSLLNDKVLPITDLTTYNIRLKQIAKICKINKQISPHLARHTFATTIALTNAMDEAEEKKVIDY